jgi:hypothetical protein
MSYKIKNQHPTCSEFGWTFTVIIFIVSIYALFKNMSYLAILLFCISVLLGTLTLAIPSVLRPVNEAWFSLGLFLGKVVSPIVLSAIFFTLITPVALITRLFGRDALLLKKRQVSSYWVDKEPIEPNSFKNQF